MIGYYVHHHGSGHRHRALSIAHAIGDEVTLLGSLGPSDGVPARYVELSRDDEPPPDPREDMTADGLLHWSPLNHAGQRQRHLQLSQWLASNSAQLLVSDVSVEAVLLARLLSVPPVAVALRGNRTDRAHAVGYDAATHILAPWSQASQHEWPARWLAKTSWTGMISRFDGRKVQRQRCDLPGSCVVVLLGRGGQTLREQDLAEASAVGGVHWHVLGNFHQRLLEHAQPVTMHGYVPDPWPFLCSADVVVAAAGDAAVADVAAARAPLIAVPQPRPFNEQEVHTEILKNQGLCVRAPAWPSRREWPHLLASAQEIGGHRWVEQSDGQGARRAGHVLQSLAAAASRMSVLV